MKIWHKEFIDKFAEKHADSTSALQRWVDIVEEAEWKTHAEYNKIDCKTI